MHTLSLYTYLSDLVLVIVWRRLCWLCVVNHQTQYTIARLHLVNLLQLYNGAVFTINSGAVFDRAIFAGYQYFDHQVQVVSFPKGQVQYLLYLSTQILGPIPD